MCSSTKWQHCQNEFQQHLSVNTYFIWYAKGAKSTLSNKQLRLFIACIGECGRKKWAEIKTLTSKNYHHLTMRDLSANTISMAMPYWECLSARQKPKPRPRSKIGHRKLGKAMHETESQWNRPTKENKKQKTKTHLCIKHVRSKCIRFRFLIPYTQSISRWLSKARYFQRQQSVPHYGISIHNNNNNKANQQQWQWDFCIHAYK